MATRCLDRHAHMVYNFMLKLEGLTDRSQDGVTTACGRVPPASALRSRALNLLAGLHPFHALGYDGKPSTLLHRRTTRPNPTDSFQLVLQRMIDENPHFR